MKKDWYWHHGAMAGALVGVALFALFTLAGATEADIALLSSPTAMVGGCAFWGVVIVWVRNKLANRGRP